ncbi:MAG: dihydroxy-acid dehydratase [Hyphomicrobiales bacterium]|nr:MAG: dihydroxy-acid dehydratase [Hyphomicrobiales bacterium]
MIGRDSREDMDAYGVWPWVGGFAIAALLIWLMFTFAAPISG